MRSRNQDGEFRHKRGDSHVGKIEKEYNINFNVRSDMHLETLRERNHGKSLTQILKETRKDK